MFTASFGVAAVRIALAIVLDTTALVVWDIGTRSPRQLAADLRAGLKDRSAFARGSLRFVIGALALGAALVVSAPPGYAGPNDAAFIGGCALVTALILEQLIGPDVRGRRERSRQP